MGVSLLVICLDLVPREYLDDTYRFKDHRDDFWYFQYPKDSQSFDYFMWELDRDLQFHVVDTFTYEDS